MNFTNLPVLTTERLTLRSVRPEDVDDIHAFTSNPVTSEWLTWNPHTTPAVTSAFIESVLEKYRNNIPAQWVIWSTADARVVGLCGFVDFSEEHAKGEVAYVVSPEYWGRGILTEALKAIITWALDSGACERIEARCEVGNIGSERAMQKAGMVLEGECRKFLRRKGVLRDYKLYAITR